MDDRYDFRTIEARWQRWWHEHRTFRAPDASEKPKFYVLEMFPYPSGAGLSVGHCKNYAPTDAFCRYKAMRGFNVLHAMGWDAFGQPAENEAIRRGRNPRDMVPEYAANYRRTLEMIGASYDWSREINSSLPDYYRWTQWFFLLLHKRGLAYRATTPINWCPSCKTGLANEEVKEGRCWRCDTPVEKRPMAQWYFKITEYADRLLADLDTIDWPDGIRQMQREWIGRSEGAEVDFPVESGGRGSGVGGRGSEVGSRDAAAESLLTPHASRLTPHASSIRVFTTRPDTLWGATFMVLAPEHPLVEQITTPGQRAEVDAYVKRAQSETEIERMNVERTKTGVFTGAYAVNPVNGERIPIWIADYVLMGYGTGAIMAVPAHDQRDFEFARKFGIPIELVYVTPDGPQTGDEMICALPEGGTMRDFAPGPDARVQGFPFAGMPNDKSTVAAVVRWLEQQGAGEGRVNYRLRDWLISRQRYWGAPIPIVHCPACGEVPVPEEQLPVLLPDVENYQPSGTGESPLATIPEFVNTACPKCGGPARRETDTMGGFACSSWYFLRFADPHNDAAFASPERIGYWLPVDLYTGGAEHAVMHLLYARFWTKVMHDAGLVDFTEPFEKLRNQGSLLAYTPGRRPRSTDDLRSAIDDDDADAGTPAPAQSTIASGPPAPNTGGVEPLRPAGQSTIDWIMLKPEERESFPPDQVVWRWVRMSKSKGNVVTPDEIAERYGADSLRVYVLFVAPFEDNVQWTDEGIHGAHRFLNRVWRWMSAAIDAGGKSHEARGESDGGAFQPPIMGESGRSDRPAMPGTATRDTAVRRKLHQTIRKVTEDIEGFRFNTAIAALMELVNELYLYRPPDAADEASPAVIAEAVEALTLLLAPFVPHMADELWSALGHTGTTYEAAWPSFDPAVAAENEITLVVQINGKVRERLTVPSDTDDETLKQTALANPRIAEMIAGQMVRKVVVVPRKLVNIVVG